MTALTIMHHAGTVLAVAGAGLAWTFVWFYRKRSWRMYAEGRHLMYFTLGMAVILSWVCIRALMGTAVGEVQDEVVRLAVYGFLAGMLGWRVHLLYAARNDGGGSHE